MRKLAISVILVSSLLLALPAGAQEMSYYGAVNLSMPIGDFGDMAGMGFGAAAGVIYPYSDVINLRGQVGYTMYGEEITDWSFSSIPIMAFAEYHWDTDTPAYALAGAGITIMRSSITILGFEVDDSSSEFGIAFGGGYSMNEAINLEGLFIMVSDANHICFQVTYGF